MQRDSLHIKLIIITFALAAVVAGGASIVAVLQAGSSGQSGTGATTAGQGPASIPEGFGFGSADDSRGAPDDLGDVNPSQIFTNARFAINGVAMRGTRIGGIILSGPPPGSVVLQAYLYWQWVGVAIPEADRHDTIRFKQVYPEKVGNAVRGTIVGFGENPCWDGANTNFTYRADVTSLVSATGGGTYGLIVPNPALGSATHANPWGCDPDEPPYMEGASLVIIYRSSCELNGTVCLYDDDLAGSMYMAAPGLTYLLRHPPMPNPISEAVWGQSTCDGQSGAGYTAFGADEVTRINGSPVAGPGSTYNDSDFNGSLGRVLPQLFDVSGHDITAEAAPTSTSTRVGIFGSAADCAVPNYNILMFR